MGPVGLARTLKSRVAAALLAAASLLAATAAQAAVWTVRGQWDEAAEARYSDWVATRFVPTIFHSDSPYAEFATDCADAAYGMRMLFAYEAGLPFVIGDPDRPGRTISQATDRFDHLPAGLPRLRAFLEWMAVNTSTATLADDTYPVRIDREQIRPGVLFLAWRRHVVQIVDVRDTGVIRYLESTSPRAIRAMTSILGFPHQVPADPKARAHGDGFRRFKWPQHYGKPEASLPGYGVEQFAQARALGREALPFHDWVRSQLARVDEPPVQRARRQLFTLCQMAWDRAGAIEEAQIALREQRAAGRRCLPRAEYDAHSTPGRDGTLKRAFEQAVAQVDRPEWASVQGRFRDFVELLVDRLPAQEVDRVRPDLLSWCDVNRVDGGPGRPMDLAELYRLARDDRLVPDPHAPVAQRWGLVPYVPTCGAR